MVERLYSVGQRPINNIVDITNFVMLEMGQPMHAFDLDSLAENRIVVKLAREGDVFTTLDQAERKLGPGTLMICDAAKPVGIGGVMGGLNSEIGPDTTRVLLEAAYFNPISIRRTSKELGLSTEASHRFERGIDPDLCVLAATRAAVLMAEMGGGRISRGVIDVHPRPFPRRALPFSPARCNAFLGSDFTTPEMVECLEGIELDVSGNGDQYQVGVPSFRVDLEREVDLYEEVARLIGYDRIAATMPPARVEPERTSPSLLLRSRAREVLEGLGLSEAINYSFIQEDFCNRLFLPEDSELRRTVSILNPLSEDQSLMRTTLIPGLLDSLRRNRAHNVASVPIYEIGMRFLQRENEILPEERLALAGLLAGTRNELSWHQAIESFDFYDAKGCLEELAETFGIESLKFQAGGCPSYYNPAVSAAMFSGKNSLGWVGRVRDDVLRNFEVKDEAFAFELDLQAVLEMGIGLPSFESLPRFPAVDRDLAVILAKEIEAGRVLEFLLDLSEDFVVDVQLFDAYEGVQVGPNRKSLAFRIQYRSSERTLTDEEVNVIHERITKKALDAFNASLRP